MVMRYNVDAVLYYEDDGSRIGFRRPLMRDVIALSIANRNKFAHKKDGDVEIVDLESMTEPAQVAEFLGRNDDFLIDRLVSIENVDGIDFATVDKREFIRWLYDASQGFGDWSRDFVAGAEKKSIPLVGGE